ncbi:MAG TPA: hypothetical protein PK339_12455 [Flavitalea sp.]|nr:hypothetical protein [Flavitalea sp.]
MTTITIGEHTLKLYSSIKELPISLSKQMSSYLLQDTGIGSSITDVDDHLAKLIKLVGSDRKEDVLEELKNLRFNLFSMLSKIDYRSLAFGCLIESVDGQKVEDRSTETLTALIDRIGITEGQLDEYLTEVKKNWIRSAA